MPRRKRLRKVVAPPGFKGLRPYGHWRKHSEDIELFYEEYEAIKLTDYSGLDHEEASALMEISRPTFARIYESARRKIARALVEVRDIKTVNKDAYIEKPETKMKKKVAIPTSKGKLDSHFGHCKEFTIITVSDGEIISEETIEAPPHQPGKLPPWLREKGVTDVIAGGIGQRAVGIFDHYNIEVHKGARQLSPGVLVEGLINDSLVLEPKQCHHH